MNASLPPYPALHDQPARAAHRARAREVHETLADADISVLPTYVHTTSKLYRRVVAQGATVMSDPGPARDEMPGTHKGRARCPRHRPHKNLGDWLQQAKADAPAAPRRLADTAPPLVVRPVALTPAAQATLEAHRPGLGGNQPGPARQRWGVRFYSGPNRAHLGSDFVRLIAAELQTGEVVWGKYGSGGKASYEFISQYALWRSS